MVSYKVIVIVAIALILHIQSTELMAQKNYKLPAEATRLKDELAGSAVDYWLVYSQKQHINDTPVYIFRYEPESTKTVNLHNTHATIILDENTKLKGFSYLHESMVRNQSFDEKEAKSIADRFLNKYAADLKDPKFQWTNIHKEKIIGADGTEKTIHAVWVKYRDPKSGQYLWVMIAPDGSIMEFDRDIVWSFLRGGRVNELWLRDEWFGKWLRKNKEK